MHQGKLTGVYDIEIQNQQQKTVALFRGNLTASAAA
jgi:acyl-CoA thioesterase